jgi:hypothetical protein
MLLPACLVWLRAPPTGRRAWMVVANVALLLALPLTFASLNAATGAVQARNAFIFAIVNGLIMVGGS